MPLRMSRHCFKYSSKDGAAEMDLRGSSSLQASGHGYQPFHRLQCVGSLLLKLLFTVNAAALEERRSAAGATLEESVMVKIKAQVVFCVLSSVLQIVGRSLPTPHHHPPPSPIVPHNNIVVRAAAGHLPN